MRKSRVYSETGFYHVVIRGVNKQNIFYDNEDRRLFLNLIKKYGKKCNIKIHAFCLMDNHVHLELQDLNKNISLFMQCVCSLYARLFNLKYDRIGHLFQERFASEIIKNNEYFLTVFRYIIQNPIKAGICDSIDYGWNSYKLYKTINSFVDMSYISSLLGNEEQIKKFLNGDTQIECLEIELRPSEKKKVTLDLVKRILNTTNPVLASDMPRKFVIEKIRKLRNAGVSIRQIVRITGVPKRIVELA